MGTNQYCAVSGALFCLVALAHILRIVLGLSIQVDEVPVPMLFSWIGFVVPAALAVWAFRLGREKRAA